MGSISTANEGADVSLLEKSINEGDSPVCHLQSFVHGMPDKSRVPWEWIANRVVNFI